MVDAYQSIHNKIYLDTGASALWLPHVLLREVKKTVVENLGRSSSLPTIKMEHLQVNTRFLLFYIKFNFISRKREVRVKNHDYNNRTPTSQYKIFVLLYFFQESLKSWY